jgi:hypothetical protein
VACLIGCGLDIWMVTHITAVEDQELGSNVPYLFLRPWALSHKRTKHPWGGRHRREPNWSRKGRSATTRAGAGNNTLAGAHVEPPDSDGGGTSGKPLLLPFRLPESEHRNYLRRLPRRRTANPALRARILELIRVQNEEYTSIYWAYVLPAKMLWRGWSSMTGADEQHPGGLILPHPKIDLEHAPQNPSIFLDASALWLHILLASGSL